MDVQEHPEILVTHLDGQKATYGIRQNMDVTNPDFLRYAERVIRKIAEHYRDNKAIIGYQIDNETTSYDTAGAEAQAGFVRYLQEKFGSIDRLNKIWGLVYWGQQLHDWTELPPRAGILNPGWKLEWDRYQDSIATRYPRLARRHRATNTCAPISSSCRISAGPRGRMSTNTRSRRISTS